MVGLDKVEDESDIQKVPASMGGESRVDEHKQAHHDVPNEERKPESTSTIDTTDLPPHAVLGMPALSPTMVRPF